MSGTTGARKRLAARSAPIRSMVLSMPDGYRPSVQQPGQRGALGLDRARLQVGGREPDAHPVHVAEAAQREPLAGHPVLRAEHGQVVGGYGAAWHRQPRPPSHGRLGVLGLGGQEEDVVAGELNLVRSAHGGNGDDGRAFRGSQAQAALAAERVEVRAAGHQHHLMPGLGQPPADGPADPAGPDDDVAHCTYCGRRLPCGRKAPRLAQRRYGFGGTVRLLVTDR